MNARTRKPRSNRGTGDGYKFLKALIGHQGEECVIWPFNKITGYGYVATGEQRNPRRAHRVMCELAHGPAPSPAHQATHSCTNGRNGCVNPNHLRWGTNSRNQRDRRQHGTANVWGSRGKLTVQQIVQIIDLRRTMTQTALAEMFGVTHSTIQYALKTQGRTRHRRSTRATA